MPSARHSAATPRWGTSEDVIERARRCMGGIDFDPCSEEIFQRVVKATTYYSLLERGEDALLLPWLGARTLCNPPGGLVREFWRKSVSASGPLIWVGFSVEQLCLLADEEHHPLAFSICILRKRIPFTRHDGFEGSPSHGNYVVGIRTDPAAFFWEFSPIGRVSHGPLVGNTSKL